MDCKGIVAKKYWKALLGRGLNLRLGSSLSLSFSVSISLTLPLSSLRILLFCHTFFLLHLSVGFFLCVCSKASCVPMQPMLPTFNFCRQEISLKLGVRTCERCPNLPKFTSGQSQVVSIRCHYYYYPTNIASVNSVMGCSKAFFPLF